MDRRDFVKGTAAGLALASTGLTMVPTSSEEGTADLGLPENYRLVCLCCGAAEGELGGEDCSQWKYRTKRMHASMFTPGDSKPEPWPEDEVMMFLDAKAYLENEGFNYLILTGDDELPLMDVLNKAHTKLKRPNTLSMFAINQVGGDVGPLVISAIVPLKDSDDKALLAWHYRGRKRPPKGSPGTRLLYVDRGRSTARCEYDEA